ncbi:MAG: hypothetical protein ACI9JN_002235 [Bacteroidia bacterium]|jgi:hypothetical protein
MKFILLIACACFALSSNAQGLISQTSTKPSTSCGSHDLMIHTNNHIPGFMAQSDKMMHDIQQVLSHNKSTNGKGVSEINVVFHVVYNNAQENIHDSVFRNQITLLNNCFRRRNADTAKLRSEFDEIVGDSKIEFKLATRDPLGNPTSGITKTSTSIKNFGGILPHGPGENAKILKWLNDSLFINYFRITEDSMGGKTAWDDTRYLNIWIGDLRIFEPNFSNFEELVYFALATPPQNHVNWPDSIFDIIPSFNQGVLMHYNAVGPNNPSKFKAPYNAYNGIVNTGKLLVHEVGHYLGLRHIWGDGDCSFDDYIDDTPKSAAASQYNCISAANTCTDTINGKDLPNMIENYMDYSSGDCQNAFTNGQIALMQNVLETYRSTIVSTKSTMVGGQFTLYPNPSNGNFNVEMPNDVTCTKYVIYDIQGAVVLSGDVSNSNRFEIQLHTKSGYYFIEVTTSIGALNQKLLID